jgi:uncharacterized repeat protein (TIGR01451 family)
MRCLDNSTRVQPSLTSLTRTVFSSTKHSKAIAKRPSRFREISISIGLGALLVALTISPAMPGVLTPGGSVTAFDETISTLAANCVDPKSSWNLGQTACATATGAPDDRRIAWVAPDGSVAQVTGLFSGTATDSYTIPTGSDPFAQVGTWTVETIDPSGAAFAAATFVVHSNVAGSTSADLSVAKYGPLDQVSAGSDVSYRIELTNHGPDDADGVTLTDIVPANTTYVSESQDSGPSFTCTAPTPGSGTGSISCTLASLPANATAVFTFTFKVNAGTSGGTAISNTARVISTTTEPHSADNNSTSSTTVSGATPPPACTVNCPTSPHVGSTSSCSTVATFTLPTTSGSCGFQEDCTEHCPIVVCSPPSGSILPVGNTLVTCSAPSGDTCTFTAIVDFTGTSNTLTINCPGDTSVSAEGLSGGTIAVNYPAPTATGNCVTVDCVPPSGSVFSLGTTPVTCTATDSSGSTSCSFTVMVTSGTGCTLSCPGDINQAAGSGQCSAVVNYPAPTTSGSCGAVTCTPPSGSTFQVGTTIVTCTTATGPSCDFTVTVGSSSSLTDLGSAPVWVGLKNSDDVGTKFDLLAEVLRKSGLPGSPEVVVGSGQINDVSGGSSSFNNAILQTILLTLDGQADFCTGDILEFRLSVRVAASSGHSSGTARLWFNDSAANSRFNATVAGAANDYFLLDGFVLDTAAGPGPKKTSDVLVNRNVGGNPFKPFGTWSKTL